MPIAAAGVSTPKRAGSVASSSTRHSAACASIFAVPLHAGSHVSETVPERRVRDRAVSAMKVTSNDPRSRASRDGPSPGFGRRRWRSLRVGRNAIAPTSAPRPAVTAAALAKPSAPLPSPIDS